ncbi:MAG: hemin uptake protein HemP [Nevskia sp.]|nr:hemin uptake protein HemP [Nevskia sp.]
MSQAQPSTGADTTGAAAAGAAAAVRQFDSRALLGVMREALILHRGEIYRLRQTRAGKLILTK